MNMDESIASLRTGPDCAEPTAPSSIKCFIGPQLMAVCVNDDDGLEPGDVASTMDYIHSNL